MSTLWTRAGDAHPWLEKFLAGEDPKLDQQLVGYDCRASLAHARMLHGIGVLDTEELQALVAGLGEIAELSAAGDFPITPADEDCHTAIENYLTGKIGEAGRKIHTGRSRNDQVLTALRLWEKDRIDELQEELAGLQIALAEVVGKQGDVALPGYTHMQAAMPATVAMWLGSFAAAAADDGSFLDHVRTMIDRSPLGSAAGFGVPVLGIDRQSTAQELGFAGVLDNPMQAQLSRGRHEALLLSACVQIMDLLNRLATDLLLFTTREFGFVQLADAVCTGSSIMPQKRNADVLELIRGRYHVVVGEEVKIRGLTTSLMSGYNRDVQLTKGPLFNGVAVTLDSLRAMTLVLEGLVMDEEACAEAMTPELFATERALELVKAGVPFRDAYRQVATMEKNKRRR